MASIIQEFIGVVVEITPKKSIVEFKLENKTERALLCYDQLKVNGQSLPDGGSFDDYINKNTALKFKCHCNNDSGVDKCGWLVISACLQQEGKTAQKSNDPIFNGLHNCRGTIKEVGERQGVLTYNVNGSEEKIVFLASKVYISRKRVFLKSNLYHLKGMQVGQKIMFDAVPCVPNEKDGGCRWFATVVWNGKKPVMKYDTQGVRNNQSATLFKISDIKLITSNPHSQFLRSEGQIMKIINAEYGLALAAIKKNRYESVLFHRSAATLFDCSLANEDLTSIFEEGDKICLLAAAATPKMSIRWVASHIGVCIDPSVAHLFQF